MAPHRQITKNVVFSDHPTSFLVHLIMIAPTRRAYFHGRHVDLLCYGRRGIKKRIKVDCGSNFICI